MVRLFDLFPSLVFTPHRDRSLIIAAVNDASEAEKVILFLYLNSAI